MSDPQAVENNPAYELKKVEAQLRLMTKVFMDSADPIVIRDFEGHILNVNHETERVFGWTREESIGQRAKQFLAPECQNAAEEIHQRRLQGETVRNFETIVRAKSGRLVPVLVTGFLLIDENGRPVAMADILKDITRIKEATEEVEKRSRDLQQFAGALSHDLAAPLGAIREFASLLVEEHSGQLDRDGQELCRWIVEGADRMDQMIKDLLELARLDNNQDGEPLPVDMQKALGDALANLRPLVQSSGAVLTSDLLPTVDGNPSQLTRLLQNLIGNAIKFCRDEPPVVHVSAKLCGDVWQFSIADNGIGIEAEHLEAVFAPLKRLHGEHVFPGTGIGLTACRFIVQRHGGRIWAESERGRGSVFHFTIPSANSTRFA